MVEQEINELENVRYRAMVSHDVTTLERLLADDLLYIHSSALVDDKTSYLHALSSGHVRYLSAERQQESFRHYGNVVLLQGRMKAHVVIAGAEKALNNVFTCVWVKKSTAWQMVSWTSTPLPAS